MAVRTAILPNHGETGGRGVAASVVHRRGNRSSSPTHRAQRRRWRDWKLLALIMLAIGSLAALAMAILTAWAPVITTAPPVTRYTSQIASLTTAVTQLEDDQTRYGLRVVSDQELQRKLSVLRIDASLNNNSVTLTELQQLRAEVATWQQQLNAHLTATNLTPPATLTVPILLYHLTPADFGRQLDALNAKGYTTITPDQLVAALSGRLSLAAKPVLITFDDGAAVQMAAYDALKTRQMKATFYIIDGGPGSHFHIGANRHLPDPWGGWDYLSWDQIRELDRSGLITIGSHTVDHLELAKQTEAVQRFEIFTGKAELETELGHAVSSFAYPYGSYSTTTIALVQEAGFTSAVTTIPGTAQIPTGIYTLHRVRDAYALP